MPRAVNKWMQKHSTTQPSVLILYHIIQPNNTFNNNSINTQLTADHNGVYKNYLICNTYSLYLL